MDIKAKQPDRKHYELTAAQAAEMIGISEPEVLLLGKLNVLKHTQEHPDGTITFHKGEIEAAQMMSSHPPTTVFDFIIRMSKGRNESGWRQGNVLEWLVYEMATHLGEEKTKAIMSKLESLLEDSWYDPIDYDHWKQNERYYRAVVENAKKYRTFKDAEHLCDEV